MDKAVDFERAYEADRRRLFWEDCPHCGKEKLFPDTILRYMGDQVCYPCWSKLTSREPCLSPKEEARLAELEKDPPQDPRIMGWHVATTMDQRQKLQIVKQKAWADYEEYQELKAKRAGCQAVEDYRQEQDEQAQDF
jgi:hypothetical protein